MEAFPSLNISYIFNKIICLFLIVKLMLEVYNVLMLEFKYFY